MQSLTEQWLEVQLANSETEMESGCPLFVPRPGVEALHKYSMVTRQHCENVGGCIALSKSMNPCISEGFHVSDVRYFCTFVDISYF